MITFLYYVLRGLESVSGKGADKLERYVIIKSVSVG